MTDDGAVGAHSPLPRVTHRVADTLARVVPAAAVVSRGVVRLAIAAAAAAVILLYALFRHGLASDSAETMLQFVAAALIVAPPLVLGAFWLALRELIEVPERIRRLPMEGREHAEELGRLVRDARAQHRRRAVRLPLHVWRLTRLIGSSRELLTPYAPLLPLLSVPFLLAVAAAAALATFEIPAALAALVVLAF